MSEESLPVQPLTLDDSRDDGRPRTGRRPRPPALRPAAGPPHPAQSARTAHSASPVHPVHPAHTQHPAPHLRRTPNVAAVAATGVGYALIAGSFRRLTVPAELSTFLAGSFLTWLALRKDCQRQPAPDHIDGKGALPWAALLVVFGVWELYADFRGSTPDHPTLSILMGPLLEEPVNRAVGYLVWLAVGGWLIRR